MSRIVSMSRIAVVACACAGVGVTSAFTIREFKQAPAVPVVVPAVPDSLGGENAFAPEQLLEARSWQREGLNTVGWTSLSADSAGHVSLVAAHDNPLLQSLHSRLSASGFAKGKLSISTPARARVLVDGKPVISKVTSDSVAAEQSADISLLPYQSVDIAVDILSMPDDKGAPEFCLSFSPEAAYDSVSLSADADARQRVQPLTVMSGERTYGASLSPDGKYLKVVTYNTVSATETKYRGRLYESASGRLVNDDVNVWSKWMPTGSALYYTSARNGKHDVYTIAVPSMRVEKIASDIPTSDFTVAPDGKSLYYYKEVKGTADEGPLHRLQSPDDRLPGNRDRSYLMRYDLANGVSLPVAYGGSSTSVLCFSNDGAKMLYFASRQTPDKYPFYYGDLIELDLKSLRTDTIVRNEEAAIHAASYSPDGSQVFIMAGPDSFGGIGANYAPHPIGNQFDVQGYILDVKSRKFRAVTRNFDPSLSGEPDWNRIDGKIYFLADKGFFRNLYCLDPKSDAIRQIETSTRFLRNFSIGNDEAQWLAYFGGDFTADGTVGVINLKSGKEHIVADPLAPSLADVNFGDMEPWTFTADDGTLIDGYLCLPPDFDASRKYPLIVYYYGGTTPSNATFYHLYTPQVFASRDYVVYVVNPSGTIGYGQEFSARHVNAWGKRTADDIIQGVKQFCKEHPYVNDKKIGCIGASYGGFMTMYLQTQTDIFAAAVSHAGISNVTSYWGEGYWGYSYNAVAAAKSYPWTDPELFTKQGALFNADKIHTPLLLLHGKVDTNVPIGESIQLFNALRILGRDVEFISVEGEDHIITGYENKILWQNTIMAWFAKYLKDDPSWWNSIYGK